MGGCVLDARRGGPVVALFAARLPVRIESESLWGKDGAKAYFSGLPGWQSQSVNFTDIVTEAVGADVVSMAGTANFVFDEKALTVKITWVIVREDGGWKILSHHVSSKAPLL